jgi:hypothetical protein
MVLAACHILHAVIQAIPSLSNPWESRSVSLLPIALCPLGWRVLPPSGARASICPPVAQLTSPADSAWPSPLIAGRHGSSGRARCEACRRGDGALGIRIGRRDFSVRPPWPTGSTRPRMRRPSRIGFALLSPLSSRWSRR